MSDKVPNYLPSSIETIDGAFLDYVEGLNLFATTINGFEKVPVIWASAERAYQIKNNRDIRDKNGSLIPPIISIERTGTTKDPNKKGTFQANLSPKNDRRYYTQIINQDKTANFANADTLKKKGQINFVTSKKNEKIVYKHISIPIPVYITVEYKIYIITNYQEQMNEIIQPFMSRVAQNYFVIKKDGHRYETFMDQDFEQESIANLEENERKYKTVIKVKVLGYLIGEGNNQEKPQLTEEENAVELKFPKENVIIVEDNEERQKRVAKTPNMASFRSQSLLIKRIYEILVLDGIEQYTIQHNMDTRDILVIVREDFNDYARVEVAIDYSNPNHIDIDMGAGEVGKKYIVTILG